MADNKNSFVFYTDWEDTFRALPKDKGYDLLIHMLDYVNDRNPETDDILINAVFQQLKNTLKRDLKGYEEKKEERSQSGRLGNLKRYHPDLYKKVTSDKLTLEAAEKIAISRKMSLSEKSVAKLAVSDSVSVSVSDSVILLEKETKDDVGDFENSEEIEKVKKVLKSSQITNDRLMMRYKISKDQLNAKIDEFVEKKFSWEENDWKNNGDLKKNFEFWLKTSLQNNNPGAAAEKITTNGKSRNNKNTNGNFNNFENSKRSLGGKTAARTILARRLANANSKIPDSDGGDITIDAEIVERFRN